MNQNLKKMISYYKPYRAVFAADMTATWSARGIRYCNDPVNGKRVLFCLLLLFLMCVIIGVWFHKYEGRQCND